jgi:flagellar hook protein FlgE
MSIFDAAATAVSGISAQAYALNNISGNIANSTTVGYKTVDTSFTDLLTNSMSDNQVSGSVGASSQTNTGVAGTVSATGINTNMAISGSGFFVVQQNLGTSDQPSFASQDLYTQRGDFSEDANGYLVNGAGYYLVGTTSGSSGDAPIKLPTSAAGGQDPSSIAIGQDGTITGTYADGSTATLGQVEVAHVTNTSSLQSLDGSTYAATSSTGTITTGLNGDTITGGSVEASNTDISDQFSKLIQTQQAYSTNTKVLTTTNEMEEDVINLMK